jgi:kynurenine formamidase
LSRKMIDLSMTVGPDMQTFPRVARPIIAQVESHSEFAANIGAAEFGVDWLTAHCVIVQGDHVGTHMDTLRHMREDAPGAEGIPLDYCYGDGVRLDFRHKEAGSIISVEDIVKAQSEMGYEIKERDIVLIWTGAGEYNLEDRYHREFCGMSAEATLYLIEKGVKVMGCDAPTFDPPVWSMFEKKKFWEAHQVMLTHEYYHLENMQNFEQLPGPIGFLLSVFPVKWEKSTGAAVRAVAIIE